MHRDRIDDNTFLLYCAKHYNNPQCQSTEEFYEDLKRIKYIKKLLTRYEITGELKERLLLNHIITLNNIFSPIPTSKILLFKISNYQHLIKPFLVFLNILPTYIYNIGINGETINTDDIPMDKTIIEVLRKI